jgi:hypothetical protein
MWAFLLWQTESVSVYHGSAESVLQNFGCLLPFKLFESALM